MHDLWLGPSPTTNSLSGYPRFGVTHRHETGTDQGPIMDQSGTDEFGPLYVISVPLSPSACCAPPCAALPVELRTPPVAGGHGARRTAAWCTSPPWRRLGIFATASPPAAATADGAALVRWFSPAPFWPEHGVHDLFQARAAAVPRVQLPVSVRAAASAASAVNTTTDPARPPYNTASGASGSPALVIGDHV